ncbi:uncharacterized protein LOC127137676 [Lathyrus oleraceus]|uniref:uncharacterized protein LOC127137676 n=1 Tax=Pisum sativum TaxID=3888 RepID=UPI0021CF4593|nr:uncharacterized protein LOC127137676 [Pisum sativum]
MDECKPAKTPMHPTCILEKEEISQKIMQETEWSVRVHMGTVSSWDPLEHSDQLDASEAFKLKGLFEQVCNDFIRDAGIRLQDCLAREAKEQARKEPEEKARLEEEQRIKEAEEKAVAEAAAAEAEAKAKAEAEEVARVTVEVAAKARVDALTQGEQSNSGFAPIVLKTLEESQKEQQVVRVRLDH